MDEVRRGKSRAFEQLYALHQPAILSFCRHLTGHREDAEDAVQHTFLSAYCQIAESEGSLELRPWLFTVARNRCLSLLRARSARGTVALDDADHATDGLTSEVEQRQELRELVGDLSRLPEQQRAALLLAQLDDMSHREIGVVLGVAPAKVKALVFQARSSLASTREAREASCSDIRSQLATSRGAALRRRKLRRHVHECDGCRTFESIVLSQRRDLAILLPVVPSIGLREAILGSIQGRDAGALATAGGAAATSVASGGAAGGGLTGSLAALGAQGAAKLAVAGVVAVGGTGAIAADLPTRIQHGSSTSEVARAPARVVALDARAAPSAEPPRATDQPWPAELGSTAPAREDVAVERLDPVERVDPVDRVDPVERLDGLHRDLEVAADPHPDALAATDASAGPVQDKDERLVPSPPDERFVPSPPDQRPRPAPMTDESPSKGSEGGNPPGIPRKGPQSESRPPAPSDLPANAPAMPGKPDPADRGQPRRHDEDRDRGAGPGNGQGDGNDRSKDAGNNGNRSNGNGNGNENSGNQSDAIGARDRGRAAGGSSGGAGTAGGAHLGRGERPSGERPSGERLSGERLSGERPSGERPSGEKPGGAKPGAQGRGGEASVNAGEGDPGGRGQGNRRNGDAGGASGDGSGNGRSGGSGGSGGSGNAGGSATRGGKH